VVRAVRQVCSYTVVSDMNLIITQRPLTLHSRSCTTLRPRPYAFLTLHSLICHPHYTPSHMHYPSTLIHASPTQHTITHAPPTLYTLTHILHCMHTLTRTTHATHPHMHHPPSHMPKVNLCDARKCKSKALLYYLCAPNSEFDCEPRYVNGYVHV